MPWQESSPMSERLAFVKACLDRSRSIREICLEFGISEKTGYKQLKRFREEGAEGMSDRSRARLTHPFRIEPEVRERIIAIRRKHPLYGAPIIRDILLQNYPDLRCPAASSIGELLSRAGLIHRKRRRSHDAERAALDTGRTRALEPNLVWTADYKGEFRLKGGLGSYCYPLTVMDLHSRFLLGCTALGTTAVDQAQKVFVSLFREYGLPSVLRTDNGVPFAQHNALGRLGRLGLWWVRLGIRPEHIKPATPSENGAHERFHRTMKAAATKPGSASLAAQQHRFDDFREEYNNHRPHSSLPGHRPPAQHYERSERAYPNKLPALLYPDSSQVRLVNGGGFIKWRNERIFISSNIAGDYVGVSESKGDRFEICYASLKLGYIGADNNRFTPEVTWTAAT